MAMRGTRNKPKPHPKLDGNVPKNWKPVEALEKRPSRMGLSDRLFHWLLTLGGIAIAAGVGTIWLGISGKLGGLMIGVGLAVFALSTPSMAQRNGYRI